jgi:hypothetical protein
MKGKLGGAVELETTTLLFNLGEEAHCFLLEMYFC